MKKLLVILFLGLFLILTLSITNSNLITAALSDSCGSCGCSCSSGMIPYACYSSDCSKFGGCYCAVPGNNPCPFGMANKCVTTCTPTCTSQADCCGSRVCGSVSNGCGTSYTCGSCTSPLVCVSGSCVCKSNYYSSCSDGHRYWYDSCGNRGNVREFCTYGCSGDRCNTCTPSNACAANTCVGQTCTDSCGIVYSGTKGPDNSCAATTCVGKSCADICGNTFSGTLQPNCPVNSECGISPNGCGTCGPAFCTPSTDVCRSNKCCTPHNETRCDSGSVYWYDSCGNREGINRSCSRGCTIDGGKPVCVEEYCSDKDECSTVGEKECGDNGEIMKCKLNTTNKCNYLDLETDCTATKGRGYRCDEGTPGVFTCELKSYPFWSNDGLNEITSKEIVPGTTPILLVMNYSWFGANEIPEFEIYERDLIFDDAIRIKKTEGKVLGGGVAIVTWIPSQADLDKTRDYNDFYFDVNNSGIFSGELDLTVLSGDYCKDQGIVSCSDYTQEYCNESDLCNVAGSDLVERQGDCISRIGVYCSWNSVKEKCELSEKDAVFTCDGGDGEWDGGSIGKCNRVDTTTDDCNDGWIKQSWTASWEWGEKNEFAIGACPVDNEGACVREGNVLHYDPFGKSKLCVSGENEFPCPGEIELPFFDLFNLFISLGIICMLYFIMKRE